MPYAIRIIDEEGRELTSYASATSPAFQPGDSLLLENHHPITVAHVEHVLGPKEHEVRVYADRTFGTALSEPRTSGGAVVDFVRYHALIRVFDGDAQAWLQILRSRQEEDSPDARFAQWIGSAINAEPALLETLRNLVETSGIWPKAQRENRDGVKGRH